jgi:hypothetical protein
MPHFMTRPLLDLNTPELVLRSTDGSLYSFDGSTEIPAESAACCCSGDAAGHGMRHRWTRSRVGSGVDRDDSRRAWRQLGYAVDAQGSGATRRVVVAMGGGIWSSSRHRIASRMTTIHSVFTNLYGQLESCGSSSRVLG